MSGVSALDVVIIESFFCSSWTNQAQPDANWFTALVLNSVWNFSNEPNAAVMAASNVGLGVFLVGVRQFQ